MLAGSERQQGFFDGAWCAGLLAENSIYGLLARHGDRIVRDEDFAECYSARWGRPSMAPSLLAEVLLLAYRNGLSDRRAMEALRFDLRWKVVLDLPIDHPEFHHTSLLKFRARLLLHGKERIVFERSLELATELGLLAGSVEQIIDSTPMLGAAAIQDTVTLRPRRGAQADRCGQGTRPGGGRTAAGGAGLRLRTSREKPAGGLARQAGAGRHVGRGRQRRAASAANGRRRRRVGGRRGGRRGAEAVARDRRPGVRDRRRRGRSRAASTTRAPHAADHLGPRPRDASRPQDQRPALYRLQAARRRGRPDAGADRDRVSPG